MRRLEKPKLDKMGRWITTPSVRAPPKQKDPRLFDGCLASFMGLPCEVQQIILSRSQRSTLAKLAAVNRYMEMLARPLLFREIRIYEPDYGAMSGVRRVERLDKFVDAVVSNPKLGTLVHSMEWNFPHERTFDMLPLLHNLQELTIWSSANQEKWEHPVNPVDFPLLTRLHVSGGYKPGGLGALVLRAPNLAAFRIDSDTFEFGLGTRQVDPNTIQHLVEKCQQVDPPSLQSVVELYLEKMDPGFRLLNPLVEYLAPQIRTLKLARDRTRDILKNVSWENGLLSLMTSHRWTSLEHLHAVDWTLSTSVQNQIRSTCPDVHVSFEPERQSSSAENSGYRG